MKTYEDWVIIVTKSLSTILVYEIGSTTIENYSSNMDNHMGAVIIPWSIVI